MFQNEVDLSSTALHLTPAGSVGPDPAPGALWTLAAFPATDDRSVHSDVWEMHPAGDELVTVLSGAIGVHLRDGDGDGDGSPAAVLRPGTAYRVPAGTWHRLTVVEPGTLLGLTPRAGTRHEHDGALERPR